METEWHEAPDMEKIAKLYDEVTELKKKVADLEALLTQTVKSDFISSQTLLNLLIQKGIATYEEYEALSINIAKRVQETDL